MQALTTPRQVFPVIIEKFLRTPFFKNTYARCFCWSQSPCFISLNLSGSAYSNPANISTSDQRYFNVVDQRWNNVDPTLKMKQNPTSDFQRRTTLIQRRCPTLKKRWNNVETTLHNVGKMLIQRCLHLASTFVKNILNPIGLVMIMDLPIHE